jgi:nucleoside-diphosphate-sugar epimerase
MSRAWTHTAPRGSPRRCFEPMRFVVTGGAGFIGSHLVQYLVHAQHDVVAVDDFSTGRRENLSGVLSDVNVVEGSITDPSVCVRAFRGADYVLHQAALPSVPRSVREPTRSHEVNATGTLNVLLAARDAGVRRVIYAGSSSVYGNTLVLPKHEEMVPQPVSPYAVSKLAGEGYCRAFHATYGLETVTLRYFNVFGPRQDPGSQYSGVIARFIAAALDGDAPTIYGDGEQTRDFTYIDNVVRANMLACQTAGAGGRVMNIGCGTRVSVNELWQRVSRVAGREVLPRYEASRASDVRDSQAAIDCARKVLGYEPSISLDEGLERTMADFAASRAA